MVRARCRFAEAGSLPALDDVTHVVHGAAVTLGAALEPAHPRAFVDVNIGGTFWGAPQTFFYPYRGSRRFGGEYRYVPGVRGSPGDYLTDRLTDLAVDFIAANKDRPFFLYLPHFAVHTPIQGKPDKVRKYDALAKPENPQNYGEYAAMIESMDESVGRVMEHLDHLSNRIGPRLTGSRDYDIAAAWAVSQFESFGLSNVRLEPWGEVAVGFHRGPASGRMVAPVEKELHFATNAWSAGTQGLVKGPVVIAPKDGAFMVTDAG